MHNDTLLKIKSYKYTYMHLIVTSYTRIWIEDLSHKDISVSIVFFVSIRRLSLAFE